jgi:hypothetical protein
MPSRAHGPEPCASANFATRAHQSTTCRQLSEITTALVDPRCDGGDRESQQDGEHCDEGGDKKAVRRHRMDTRRLWLKRVRIIHRQTASTTSSCRVISRARRPFTGQT